MKEAKTGTVEIMDVEGDVDDETVMRFIEYAYTGDYTVPEAEVEVVEPEEKVDANSTDIDNGQPREEEPAEEPAALEEEPLHEDAGPLQWEREMSPAKRRLQKKRAMYNDNPWSFGGDPRPEEARKVSERDKMWDKFLDLAAVKEKPKAWEPPENLSDTEDHVQVFLCHARLYVFSDRYECGGLRDLSLQKLRLTLSRFKLYEKRVSDVVRLISYTYGHTPDLNHGTDKLRGLVIEYAVCQVESLMKDENFLAMLEETGQLARDLMVAMLQRLD